MFTWIVSAFIVYAKRSIKSREKGILFNMKASVIFNNLADRGDFLVNTARNKGWSPNFQKKLRTFGMLDAAKMCGRSAQHIRRLEDDGKIPKPPSINGRREYSLEHINNLRDYFNTRPSREKKKPFVLAIDNSKGGVTKSKTAIHTAQNFALKGLKVLLIDGDHQASITMDAGFSPREHIGINSTLLPFFRKPIPGLTDGTNDTYIENLSSVIKKTYFPGLDVIPANLGLFNLAFEIPVIVQLSKINNVEFDFFHVLRDGLFGTKSIKGIAHNYDVIIIDCPPYLDVVSFNAIYAADALIIPTPPIMTDISSTQEFFEMMKDTFTSFPDKEFAFVKLLISKHLPPSESNPDSIRNKTNHNIRIAQSLKHIFNEYVLENTMIASDAVEKTSTEIKTIYDISPKDFSEKLKGDRKTLKRAVEAANAVSNEIYSLIQSFWEQQPDWVSPC